MPRSPLPPSRIAVGRSLLPLILMLGACSPTYDWRDISGPAALFAQLPCKPDKAERDMPVEGRPLRVQMMGCAAGGTTFAIAAIEVGVNPTTQEGARLWEAASLRAAQARVQSRVARVPPGAAFGEQVDASGHAADGQASASRALYFGRGAVVYQAIALGPKLDTDAVESFFSSVRLR